MDKYYLKNARKRCFLPAGVFYPPRLYKDFTVPKSLDEGNYEKFKTAYENWRCSSATIKEYFLILYDLDYIFDAVDAVQSMHLDPPDRNATFLEQHATSVTAEFKAAQKGK